MALKYQVDSLDGLDDDLKALYTEKDGKFVLDVEGVEDTSGLKESLRASNKEAMERRKQLEAWKRIGKTPDEIEELLEAQRVADEEKATKKGEWEKLKAQMNETHQKELSKKDELVSKMRSALERHLVDAAATAAIASAKGVPDLLLPHVQRHVKVVEDDNGEFSVQVVDAKGDPRVNGKGEALTISDLVAEMRGSDVFGRAFEGSGHSGSGMKPANGAGGAGTTKKSDFKSEKERAAWVDEHGIDAYKALPD